MEKQSVWEQKACEFHPLHCLYQCRVPGAGSVCSFEAWIQLLSGNLAPLAALLGHQTYSHCRRRHTDGRGRVTVNHHSFSCNSTPKMLSVRRTDVSGAFYLHLPVAVLHWCGLITMECWSAKGWNRLSTDGDTHRANLIKSPWTEVGDGLISVTNGNAVLSHTSLWLAELSTSSGWLIKW